MNEERDIHALTYLINHSPTHPPTSSTGMMTMGVYYLMIKRRQEEAAMIQPGG